MDQTLERLLFLFLGWLLGLSSPIIVDTLKRRRENREVRAALRIELMELQYRLACAVYMIEIRFGTLTKELLSWVRPIAANYKGLNPSENLLKVVDKLLALPDDQIGLMSDMGKAEKDGALALKKYSAPLLDSKFALLSTLDPNLQNRLLEVRVHLSLFNEEVDQARYYFQLTFNGGLSEGNRERVVTNLTACYKNAASRARTVVDHIGKINW